MYEMEPRISFRLEISSLHQPNTIYHPLHFPDSLSNIFAASSEMFGRSVIICSHRLDDHLHKLHFWYSKGA